MKAAFLIIFIYLSIVFGGAYSCLNPEVVFATSKKMDHSLLEKLLKKYVRGDSLIDYDQINQDQIFFKYLNSLENANPFAKNWSKNEKISFWINCYNACVIKLIGQNDGVNSIKEIDNCWSQMVIEINETSYSLSDIEHGILRKFNEPRIHFALVCGAKSCPKIFSKPIYTKSFEEQIQKRTNAFLHDKSKNELSLDSVRISKIFSWFKSDFTVNNSLIEFINRNSNFNLNKNADISFLQYNWELNRI